MCELEVHEDSELEGEQYVPEEQQFNLDHGQWWSCRGRRWDAKCTSSLLSISSSSLGTHAFP